MSSPILPAGPAIAPICASMPRRREAACSGWRKREWRREVVPLRAAAPDEVPGFERLAGFLMASLGLQASPSAATRRVRER